LKSAPTSSLNTNFSFEDTIRQEVDDKEADENRKKIVNLEILSEDNNGWNPLNPYKSIYPEKNYEQQSNAEDERLLTRCDSTTKTNAISDSMTNVTKMILTSSSSSDSNFVHSSNPINSVTSSIESSITSSSSDQENGFPTEDSDKYWQLL